MKIADGTIMCRLIFMWLGMMLSLLSPRAFAEVVGELESRGITVSSARDIEGRVMLFKEIFAKLRRNELNPEMLEEMLSSWLDSLEGQDVETLSIDWHPFLCTAIRQSATSMVSKFIELGANLNLPCKTPYRVGVHGGSSMLPCHFAVMLGNKSVIDALWPNCVLNQKDEIGYSALDAAVAGNQATVVTRLLDAGLNPDENRTFSHHSAKTTYEYARHHFRDCARAIDQWMVARYAAMGAEELKAEKERSWSRNDGCLSQPRNH